MNQEDYLGPWPWMHFQPSEIACRCCGELWPGDDPMPDFFSEALDALEELREAWGGPIVINSGHRCGDHNSSVGGVPGSRHLEIAFDCRCGGQRQKDFVSLARQCGFTGVGFYPERGFVHLDLGPVREWEE